MLISTEDFSPVATATINIPQAPLNDDCVIIKDYSENKGILDALVSAGIIHPPHAKIYLSQWVDGMVCRLK